MMVGYARTSTEGETPQSQIDSLKTAHCKRIFVDQMTGHSLQRPELARCLRTLGENDTLVVSRLEILGRSLRDLLNIVTGLQEREIQFLSLKENINTKHAAGKLIFQSFAMVAEFQHDIIRERTMTGLANARAKGRFGGNRKKTTPAEDRQMIALWKTKRFSVTEIAEQFGVSEPTLHRRLSPKKSARRPKPNKMNT
jgi:DNA invertase Pin-like site-specific DNA recombinase